MTQTQTHRINIEADPDSVFEALSTAEGWSRWFTPEVTGAFTEGAEIVCWPSSHPAIRLRVASVKPKDHSDLRCATGDSGDHYGHDCQGSTVVSAN
jgi:uncharacterized protein YndB with AHSA1/START domain